MDFFIVKNVKIEKSDLLVLKSKIVNNYRFTKAELKRDNFISKLLTKLKGIVY
jgi:hypothetical protein